MTRTGFFVYCFYVFLFTNLLHGGASMPNSSGIQTILVIGAGQMGRGIAQTCAQFGKRVIVTDALPEVLPKARDFIEQQWQRAVGKAKCTAQQVEQWSSQLVMASSWQEIPWDSVDFAIEAIKEDFELKKSVLQKLDQKLKPSAMMASNTSSISLTQMAAATSRPAQVIGMHFMNPVPVMKLVEIIPALQTDQATLETVQRLAEELGKTQVLSRDYPGFIVNRVLMPMINEAAYTLYEGVAKAEDIDQGMKEGTNVPMGPLELADFIGLDTCLSIMEVLHEGFSDSKYRPCPLLKQYVDAGWLGRKTKRGFFSYE